MPRQRKLTPNRRLRVTHRRRGISVEYLPIADGRDPIVSENTVHYALLGGGITQLPNLMRYYQARGFQTELVDCPTQRRTEC